MEAIRDVIIFLAIAAVCGILAAFLKSRKKRILAKTEYLIQWAETQIEGSKMGEKKKALVIARLKEDKIHITKWLDKTIDNTVTFLNKTSGWMKETADIEGTAKELADEIKGDE